LQRLRAARVPPLWHRPAARFGIDGARAAAGPRRVPKAGGSGVLQYPRAPGLTRRDLRRPGQFRPCPEPGQGFRAGVESQAPLLARPAQRCPAIPGGRLRLVPAGLVHDSRVGSAIDQDKRVSWRTRASWRKGTAPRRRATASLDPTRRLMHGRFALLDAPFRESLTGSGSFGAYDTGRCTTRALKLASWPTLGSQPDNGSVKRSEIRAHPATRIGPRPPRTARRAVRPRPAVLKINSASRCNRRRLP
jgi:hypothetical protein